MSNAQLAVNTIKGLSMDAVEAAGCGHPGMPMGMADAAYVLWAQHIKFNPKQPNWPDRDRFVLSNGHGSMLLYSMLYLTGYPDIGLDDIKEFRQWGARTAGHPEYGEAAGIETTTGPLGQGVSNAVGMALAERLLAGRYNTSNATLVDHHTYVFAGDGCLMEGVSSEACSLAGHLKLGKLIMLWDDNSITIDGTTEIAFTENVASRFESYGWQTLRCDGHNHDELNQAFNAAKADTERPTLICARTHIGHGSPNKQDTSAAHGAKLGADEIRITKEGMNWPTDQDFYVPEEAKTAFDSGVQSGQEAYHAWLRARESADAETVRAMDNQLSGKIPEGLWDKLPGFEVGGKVATRKASGAVLNALCADLPGLIGGSADLAGSNNTDLKGFDEVQAGHFSANNRNIRFGVREHGMAAICNGMALHGGMRPYAGTFLVFSDYMRPSIRLAALMKQPVTYVFTHDSVFLGEDGPTHQPVEHAMALRLIPNSWVIRPADANETKYGWQIALERQDGPTSLLLSRQGLPTLAECDGDGVRRGGYVLRKEAGDTPELILIATGSEVHIALETAKNLGPNVRVVSMPCLELFDGQSQVYKDEVLPPNVTKRLAIEAGRTFGWEKYVGSDGIIHGIDRFGTSAPAERIAEEWGFTTEALTNKAQDYLND
jgi:transketolase